MVRQCSFSRVPRLHGALARLKAGNTSSLKALGVGLHEVRIDLGPDYRVFLSWDGTELVILLGGNGKARQSAAIKDAQGRWTDHRRRSEQEID